MDNKDDHSMKNDRGLMEKSKRNQNLMHLLKRVHGMIGHADLEKHRLSQDHIGGLMGSSRDTVIREFQIGDIEAEWVSMTKTHGHKRVILYCHGGGYSTGSRIYARSVTTKLAAASAMDVLSFNYRLAPEYPYPAAMEDAVKVWDYLMLQGYGARDVVVAGDSAGGNLALVLVRRLQQQGRGLPKGLVLLSPWADLTSSGESHALKREVDPVVNEAYLRQMVHNYAEGRDLKNPLLSPLFGDFSGFPPTYIQVGENEILLSDSIQLHQKLDEARVMTKLDIFDGMWHVFQMMKMRQTTEAMDQIARFLFQLFE